MSKNHPTDTQSEDEQWLSAIAGRPDPLAEENLNREAAALRRVLISRRKKIESSTPVADDALLQKIRFRLRREGLDRGDFDTPKMQRAVFRTSQRQSVPQQGSNHATKAFNKSWNYRAWGMAASIMVGVAIVVQFGIKPHSSNEGDVVRGDSFITTLIVDDPQSRLADLLSGLRDLGVEPEVAQIEDSGVILKIPANDRSRNYLLSQRIEGKERDGVVVLLLSKQPSN